MDLKIFLPLLKQGPCHQVRELSPFWEKNKNIYLNETFYVRSILIGQCQKSQGNKESTKKNGCDVQSSNFSKTVIISHI